MIRRALLLASMLGLLSPLSLADELKVAEGVVVKFGIDGQLVIRDGLVVDGEVVFTSVNDDASGGATQSGPSTPQPGDWLGIRLEQSAPGTLTQLQGLRLLFGGNGVASFTLARTQIPLSGFSIHHSAGVGLAALTGTTSPLSELVLGDNDAGFQAEAGVSSTLSASVVAGNASFGAIQLDATGPLAAGNVWWGHPSGPLDTSDDTADGGLFKPRRAGQRGHRRHPLRPVRDGHSAVRAERRPRAG